MPNEKLAARHPPGIRLAISWNPKLAIAKARAVWDNHTDAGLAWAQGRLGPQLGPELGPGPGLGRATNQSDKGLIV